MCLCLPTAVEVDTIDRTPYGRKVVRKTTYGLHTTSNSSSFSSNEKPRRRFGSKTDYYDDAYYAAKQPIMPTSTARQITYDVLPPAPRSSHGFGLRQPLLLEPPPPPMPAIDSHHHHHGSLGYNVNVIDAHPTGVYAPSPPLIYDAEPDMYEPRPRAALPRGVSTRRRNSVRYGRGNPMDSGNSLEYGTGHYSDGYGSIRSGRSGREVRFN